MTLDFKRSVFYNTLYPCDLCVGAIIFFTIPKVVIGEKSIIRERRHTCQSRGVEVAVLNDPGCIQMLREVYEHNPGIWNKGALVIKKDYPL